MILFDKKSAVESSTRRHANGLDLLRVFLCIGVVLYHYSLVRPASGPFMVIGFFVMGGFLLGEYFNHIESFPVLDFYNRKARRLLPMFLIAWSLGVVLGARHGIPENLWKNFSFCGIFTLGNIPLWYMLVEFSMLICAPLLFFIYKKKFGILTLFLLSTILSGVLFAHIPYCAPFGNGLYFSPVARCYQFVAGLLIALIHGHVYKFSESTKKSIALIACFIFLGLWLTSLMLRQKEDLSYWNYTFEFDILAVTFYVILIPILYELKILGKRVSQCIMLLAALSYPLYLFHDVLLLLTQMIIGKLTGTGYPTLCFIVAAFFSLAASFALLKAQQMFERRLSVSKAHEPK